ncbi:MAG TPA: sulfotransferase domain-containing protein [Rhizomicrobium sp.]|nr:sulfotransferase domain-containing protein [Rhizomicrobium sp.]
MARTLILVAGYPKSGTTWVRIVFEALRRGPGQGISINQMEGGYYGGRRRLLFDEVAPVNSADLLPEEVDGFLPEVFRALSERGGAPHIVKAHDCAFRTRSGEWLYPPDCVQAVIYLTRHPFDVAVSYAHHLGLSVGEAVRHMGAEETVAHSDRRLRLPLHERLGSWSGNVSSWLDVPGYDVALARYEDIFENPATSFARLIRAAGLSTSEAEIARVCEATQFERLRSEEERAGFFERPRTSPNFFRAGRPRSWTGALDDELRAELVHDHDAVMTRLGYDAEGGANAAPDLPAIA